MTPKIGITLGDPGGIGPEVVEKALASLKGLVDFEPVLFGESKASLKGATAEGGQIAYDSIISAIDMALAGDIGALVTAPISKTSFSMANIGYTGHTTLLEDKTKSQHVRMAFYSRPLNVILNSVHIPLHKVPSSLTKQSLIETINRGQQFLNLLGVDKPKIAIAGLNPHAGEDGMFGTEESDVIEPVIEECLAKGLNVSGPYPPDTLFFRAVKKEFDLVVALYHDQGLIPLKLLAFDEAVNVSLGLPFIRTSPDHGTAFDIAGQDKANPTSMIEAIKCAITLSKRHGA